MTNNRQYRDWQDYLKESLDDPEDALMYLEIAISEYEQDGDREAFLLALRNVADAQGGLGALSERTGLNREHLYRALSKTGNPRLDTVGKILNGLGFRLAVKSRESTPLRS